MKIVILIFCLLSIQTYGQKFTFEKCNDIHNHNRLYYIRQGVDSIQQRIYFYDRKHLNIGLDLLNKNIISFGDFFDLKKLKVVNPIDSFCNNSFINFNLNSVAILKIQIQKVRGETKMIIYIQDWFEQGMKAICFPLDKSLKNIKTIKKKNIIGKSELCILEV